MRFPIDIELTEKNNTLMLKKNKLNDLANQFRCPEGEEGIAMGELLHQTNGEIIKESIKALELEDKNRVLELGHGNCNHLPFLMNQALHLKYFGMEISEVMVKEASRINEEYINASEALFQLYDGNRIPYVHNIFDRILTINTIYFWKDPVDYINEMFRVLKPGGVFVLTFTNSSFLEQLSLVANNDIFVLYDKQKIKELVASTDFILSSIEEKIERTKNNEGEWIDRNFSVVVLRKKAKNKHLEI